MHVYMYTAYFYLRLTSIHPQTHNAPQNVTVLNPKREFLLAQNKKESSEAGDGHTVGRGPDLAVKRIKMTQASKERGENKVNKC